MTHASDSMPPDIPTTAGDYRPRQSPADTAPTDLGAFNRSLAVRWFEDVWNRRRDETVDELMSESTRGHLEGQGTVDRAQFKAFRTAMLGAFSDLHVDILDTAVDGSNVVLRWRLTGTHDGNGLGFPASGRSIDVPGMTWLVFRDGVIEKGWDAWNQGDFIETLQSRS